MRTAQFLEVVRSSGKPCLATATPLCTCHDTRLNRLRSRSPKTSSSCRIYIFSHHWGSALGLRFQDVRNNFFDFNGQIYFRNRNMGHRHNCDFWRPTSRHFAHSPWLFSRLSLNSMTYPSFQTEWQPCTRVSTAVPKCKIRSANVVSIPTVFIKNEQINWTQTLAFQSNLSAWNARTPLTKANTVSRKLRYFRCQFCTQSSAHIQT